MEFNKTSVIEILKLHQENTPDWVIQAREKRKVLKALVHGDGFLDVLIDQIEKIESNSKAEARKKYSKDIRDVFHRIMKTRDNVFEANGGSEKLLVENDRVRADFFKHYEEFKSNKSLYKYLSEYYFGLVDTDPNGLILLEYLTFPELKLYPTYKAIKDIRFYEPNGQLVEYLVMEPEKRIDTKTTVWRLIDDKTDWTVYENSGIWIIKDDMTFEHPFGKVPALILSDIEKVGTNERLSPITPIEELGKDLARDKSILNIYKFQNGFPIHWRYVSNCKTCTGTGKTGSNEKCANCDGKGILTKADVTDLVTIQKPSEKEDPIIAPNIAGFISPDLETWTKYNEDLRMFENIMYDTIWGTEKTQELQNTAEKTATGEFLDVQPMTNTLNGFTDAVEYIHNTLAHWILNFVDLTKDRNERLYNMAYGRRYILESPDVILEKYQKAKTQHDNNTILDKLLEEFVLSKYKSDPNMQFQMLKKIKVEPYVHESIQTMTAFGPKESLKKILFQKFWEQADISKETEQLQKEFLIYFNNESSEILQTIAKASERAAAGAV